MDTKKIKNYLEIEVNKISPKEGDIIMVKLPFYQYNIDEAQCIYNMFKELTPKNASFLTFKDIDFKALNKSNIIDLIRGYELTIERLKGILKNG